MPKMFLNQQSHSRTEQSSFIPLRINIRNNEHHNQPLFFKYHDASYHIKAAQKPVFQRFLLALDRKFPVFQPESQIMIVWNFLVMISIIINIYEIPIAIFFTDAVYESEFTTTIGIVLNWIFFSIIAIDWLAIRPSTPVERRGYLLSKRIQIVKKYLQLQFWLDGISTIVLFIYIITSNRKLVYLKLFFYLKIFALYKLNEFMNARLQMLRMRLAIYQIIFLLMIILIFTIWVSGIYFAIDYSYYVIGPTPENIYYPNNLWLTNSVCTTVTNITGQTNNIDLISTYEWWVWFDYAMYWALQTISTLGYGDNTPRNPTEVVYCNIVILFTVFIFAIFVNSVWDIISQARQPQTKISQNLRAYKQFKNANKIPQELSQKLLVYLHQKWQHEQDEQITKIITQLLPDQLKDELNLGYRIKIFKNIKLFEKSNYIDARGNTCQNPWSFVDFQDYSDFVLQLVNSITERRFAQQQIVYNSISNRECLRKSEINASNKQHQKQYIDQTTLYYILWGDLHKSFPPGKYNIRKKKGETIGEIQFITGFPNLSIVRSIGFSKLACLKRSSFVSIVKKFPYLHQKYCQFHQSVMFEKQVSLINIQCWQCQQSHYFMFCPKLFPVTSQIRANLLEKVGNQKRSNLSQNRACATRRKYKMGQKKVHNHRIMDSKDKDNIDKVKDRIIYRPTMNIN